NNVHLNNTGSATGTLSFDSSTGATRTITISNISGDGTLGVSIDAGSSVDQAGNSSAAATSTTFVVDNTGPTTSNPNVSPSPTNTAPKVSATIDDSATGDTNIQAAEFFIDTVGSNGSGTSLTGTFTSAKVDVAGASISSDFAALSEGTHTVYIHGKDAL